MQEALVFGLDNENVGSWPDITNLEAWSNTAYLNIVSTQPVSRCDSFKHKMKERERSKMHAN